MTIAGLVRQDTARKVGELNSRSHWLCSLLGHRFKAYKNGGWFWCKRCAKQVAS